MVLVRSTSTTHGDPLTSFYKWWRCCFGPNGPHRGIIKDLRSVYLPLRVSGKMDDQESFSVERLHIMKCRTFRSIIEHKTSTKRLSRICQSHDGYLVTKKRNLPKQYKWKVYKDNHPSDTPMGSFVCRHISERTETRSEQDSHSEPQNGLREI